MSAAARVRDVGRVDAALSRSARARDARDTSSGPGPMSPAAESPRDPIAFAMPASPPVALPPDAAADAAADAAPRSLRAQCAPRMPPRDAAAARAFRPHLWMMSAHTPRRCTVRVVESANGLNSKPARETRGETPDGVWGGVRKDALGQNDPDSTAERIDRSYVLTDVRW